MVQGKFKKTKLPDSLQKKQKKKNSVAFTRRPNAPIQAKKGKFSENQKIKQAISRTVNKSVESELRSRASQGQIKLSKPQQAVASHHQALTVATEAASTSAGASTST